MTILQQLSASQASPEVPINENFESIEWASIFGRRHAATTGLTWAYYGGRYGGTLIADGTLTLSASSTNYVVVHRTTGVVSLASGSPNEWDAPSTYARLYRIVTGSTSITSVQDHRLGAYGLFETAAAGDASTSGTLAQFAATTSAQLRSVLSDETGTGAAVFATSPTLVTPAIGAATATSVNKVALTQPASGSTLTIADGKTLTASKSITLDGTDGTTMTFPEASASVGFRNVPQNSQSTAYTTVLADSGKHLLHPSADTTARTFTIDSNANVAYQIGTAITFVNQASAGVLTIAITSDTMRMAGTGSTGSRILAANGIATALKVTSTEWIISGTGLT